MALLQNNHTKLFYAPYILREFKMHWILCGMVLAFSPPIQTSKKTITNKMYGIKKYFFYVSVIYGRKGKWYKKKSINIKKKSTKL